MRLIVEAIFPRTRYCGCAVAATSSKVPLNEKRIWPMRSIDDEVEWTEKPGNFCQVPPTTPPATFEQLKLVSHRRLVNPLETLSLP
jgi:hypothetical protein